MKTQLPIYETANFHIQAARRPYVDRAEGGHIYLFPKVAVRDRTQLSPSLAIEYTKLSMVVGEAMVPALARRGIEIGLVNYQDMGNWSVYNPEGPSLHMHIYGRATTATKQKYGEAVQLPFRESGFYDDFQPLDDQDIAELRVEIERLRTSAKYAASWHES